MKKLSLCLMLIVSGCYTNPTDVGRTSDESYEKKLRNQQELIQRQQEVIKRQERELKDIERQKYYNQQYERFNPVE